MKKQISFYMNKVEVLLVNIDEAFHDLQFEPERHIYRIGNKTLPSVSSMIKKHVEPFDEIYWANKVANKRKCSVAEVLKEWEDKRNKSTTNGTSVHLFAEKWWEDKTKVATTIQEQGLEKFLKYITEEKGYELVCTEIQMYSKIYNYAGTCDLLVYDPINDKVILLDYKTNFELDKQYNYLLEPFNYLPDTQSNKYQIQLSYYQIMLEEAGIKVDERYVVWLKHNGEYEMRYCNDFTDTLKNYLNENN